MRSLFMRWKWRLWTRTGTLKTTCLIAMFLVASFMITQNLNGYGQPSEVIVRADPQPEAKEELKSEPKDELKLEPNQDPKQEPKLESNPKTDKIKLSNFEEDLHPTVPTNKDNPISEPFSDWLTVQHADREIFVYSAYLDQRKTSRYVRVIAIVKRRKKVTECELVIGTTTKRVPGKVKLIRENWNLLYSASFILCDLPSGIETPQAVTLVHNGQIDKSSTVPVQVMTGRRPIGNMSVCIKPFHYNFNRAVWLVEFMELYRILGANHFIYYNHTVGPDVQSVLEYYEKQGVATILPWSLPVKSQKEIRTEGIFAALNDCNYRSIGRFDYAALVDVDEFLVPRGYPGLLELIANLGDYDTYIFQNVFYYLYWENDTAVHDALFGDNDLHPLGVSLFGEESLTPYLLTSYKTRRLTKPHKPGQRSKYIVRPEKVVEVGNHNVWEHVGSKHVLNVPENKGLSHHYRICEFGGYECLKANNEIDRAAHQWMVPLMKRVAQRCKDIFPSLQRCPIAPPLGSPW